ncbi:hypothetical protein SAMN05216223_13462 [Actinacidiphila yanglinensis]|uniref:Uncharacterized protein n=1 Tax=Actinacidiphila yanglinensis TaxID=310779 RepID=A0A1H6ED63_9ACTN|nr:hypothetical protein SAMN05216223_13462 [Actinacidiphila yanglinensis]
MSRSDPYAGTTAVNGQVGHAAFARGESPGGAVRKLCDELTVTTTLLGKRITAWMAVRPRPCEQLPQAICPVASRFGGATWLPTCR